MRFNLIEEQWIPVKRRDGAEVRITPSQITDGFADNPVVAVNAPRPDFNGALIQFLIGLVQTVAAPADEDEWEDLLDAPPTPEDLRRKFMTVSQAFELGGDGPRFMQESNNLETDDSGIDGLLIDMPGKSTRKRNTDHFVKRDTITRMCLSCAATAILAMQTNAPEGGRGYLASLRGGGPLTTLVLGDERFSSLWHTVWLNTLTHDVFLRTCGDRSRNAHADMFPWLAKIGTRAITTPQDVHPAQMYWGMPRRIRLNLQLRENGHCEVCGSHSADLLRTYRERPHGINYKGAWLHPLSPYSFRNGVPSAIHARAGGVTYRHWLGLVQGDGAEKQPARVVHEFRSRQDSSWQFRLWAFGYDMAKNNALCWYEGVMPLITVKSDQKQEYESQVASMIKAADLTCGNLKVAVKRAFHGKPYLDPVTKKLKWKYPDIRKTLSDEEDEQKRVLYTTKDISTFMGLGSFFWQRTESEFYRTLNGLKMTIDEESSSREIGKDWHDSLCRAALELFDAHAWEGPIEDADPKRVVLARRELEQFNRSRKIKTLLGL